MPKRVQMTRKKGGWRHLHPDAVIVTRGPGSRWGNPYKGDGKNPNRAMLTALYAAYILRPEQDALRAAIRADLAGKDLACVCPLDGPCHADVMLELANAPEPDLTRFLNGFERVQLDDDGTLDEIVTRGHGAHLEQMNDKSWFLAMQRSDGTEIAVWLSSDTPITAIWED